MKHNRGYDEVMIVNPYDPQSTNQQTNLMRFHHITRNGLLRSPGQTMVIMPTRPQMGYYARAAGRLRYYADQPELAMAIPTATTLTNR